MQSVSSCILYAKAAVGLYASMMLTGLRLSAIIASSGQPCLRYICRSELTGLHLRYIFMALLPAAYRLLLMDMRLSLSPLYRNSHIAAPGGREGGSPTEAYPGPPS